MLFLFLPAADKIVSVHSCAEELGLSLVSTAADADPWAPRDAYHHFDDSHRVRHEWHAMRVHNHDREMAAAEACCERAGSCMKDIINWAACQSTRT